MSAMSAEIFDDFDSTDVAMQLTEMANRHLHDSQTIAMDSGIISNDSQSQAIFRGPVQMQSDMGTASQTLINALQQQSRMSNISLPQAVSLLQGVSLAQGVARSQGVSTPFGTELGLCESQLSNQRLRHNLTTQPVDNFDLEDLLLPTTPTSTMSFGITSTIETIARDTIPTRNVGSLPLSFLPSCSFILSDMGTKHKTVTGDNIAGSNVAQVTKSPVSRRGDMVRQSGNNCPQTGSVVTSQTTGPSIDFSALLAAYDFRQNAANNARKLTVTPPPPPTQMTSAAMEDKEAEALMQRMIEEGRLHTKRTRTSNRSGSLDVSRHSVSDVSNSVTTSNGLNLSVGLGGNNGGREDLSVKEELSEVSVGHGQLIPVTGSTSSKHFDNLYLAYSAAMQQAAAGATSAAGGPEQLDLKSSQNSLLAGAASMQSFAGASILDGGSVDAQAAQAARLAMLHFQIPPTTAAAAAASKSPSGRRFPMPGKTFHCLACGKALSSLHNLKLHEATVHRGLFQYRCPLCGKGLRQERDLRGHLANRHNMKKDFRCSVCGNEFGYKRNLKQHMVSYHGWKDPVVLT